MDITINRIAFLGFHIFCSLSLVFLSSCYKLENEVFTVVDKPDGKIGIALNSAEDTIYVYECTTMHYSLILDKESLTEAEVKIDGKHLYSKSTENMVSFELDPQDFGSGYFTLNLKVYLKTGSGSLADKVDAEFLIADYNRVLYIDLSPPTNILEARFVIEDGKSLLRWNKPNKDNFLHFYIFRNNSRDSIVVAPEKFEYHDTLYAGGPATYRVGIRGYNFHQESEIRVNENIIEDFEWSLLESNGIQISTPNFRLYNNNLKLQIENIKNYRGLNEYVDKVDKSTSLIEDRPLYLGEVRKFSIELGSSWNSGAYEDTLDVYLGTRIKEHVHSHVFKDKDVLLLASKSPYVKNKKGHTIIYKYKFSEMTLIDSLKIDVELNNSAKLLCSQNGENNYIIDYYENKIKKLDINKMQVVYHSEIPDYFPEFSNYSSPISSVSNNNLLCVYNDMTRYVVDLSTNDVIFEHLGNYSYATLSPNGKFLYLNQPHHITGRSAGVIYERDGMSFVRKGYLRISIQTQNCHFYVENGIHKLIGAYSTWGYGDNIYYSFNLDVEPDEDGYLINDGKSPEIVAKNGRFDYLSNSIYGGDYEADIGGLYVYDITDWSITTRKTIGVDNIHYYNGKFISPAGSMFE